MIYDILENSDFYKNLSERFAIAFEYLQITDLSKIETGRHEIKEPGIFALVSEYQTQDKRQVKWEAHKKYADIQLLAFGEEKTGFTALKNLKCIESYNAEKDISFFEGTGEYVSLTPGAFVVFFPPDGHQPGIAAGNPSKVKKIVIKVLMDGL